MTAKNDITGDTIASKTTTDNYRDGWTNIFKRREIFYFNDGTWCDRAELPYIAASMDVYENTDEEVKKLTIQGDVSDQQIDELVRAALRRDHSHHD